VCKGSQRVEWVPASVDCYGQQIALRIDDELPFAPIDLFTAIKAAFDATFGGFDRLAVQDDCGRLWVTPLLRSHSPAQAIMNL